MSSGKNSSSTFPNSKPRMARRATRRDVMTPAQRSRCMSRIRGKDTGPEMALRKALWAVGLRYRLHYKLPGKPDIVFPGKKVAVFVDGCFWHGCPEHGVQPKTRAEFWRAKISKNRERDRRVTSTLKSNGWVVVRIWEHEIEQNTRGAVSRIRELVTRSHTVKYKVMPPQA